MNGIFEPFGIFTVIP